MPTKHPTYSFPISPPTTFLPNYFNPKQLHYPSSSLPPGDKFSLPLRLCISVSVCLCALVCVHQCVCVCEALFGRVEVNWSDLVKSVGEITCAALGCSRILLLGTNQGRVLLFQLPLQSADIDRTKSLSHLALILKAPFDRLDTVTALSLTQTGVSNCVCVSVCVCKCVGVCVCVSVFVCVTYYDMCGTHNCAYR